MRLWAIACVAGPFAILSCACEAQPTPPIPTSSNWVIAGIKCPEGCSSLVRKLAIEYRGKLVVMAGDRFVNPLSEGCDGRVDYSRINWQPAAAFFRTLPGKLPTSRPVKPRALGIKSEKIWAGQILCAADQPSSIVANVAIENERRGFILFEEGTYIELRRQ